MLGLGISHAQMVESVLNRAYAKAVAAMRTYLEAMEGAMYAAPPPDGGSDRLIDALVAWGDEKAIERRIQAHRDAGASHVCIQPINPDGSLLPDMQVVEAMAPAP